MATCVCFGLSPHLLWGQTLWEITPYRVTASIAADRAAFSATEQALLEKRLEELALAHLGAGWSFATIPPSHSLRGEMSARFDELTVENIFHWDAAAGTSDKRMLVVITRREQGYSLAVRELDVTTRQLGPTVTRFAPSRNRVAMETLNALVDAFSPLVELERATGDTIAGQLRAATLVDDPQSPLLVEAGAPLIPVLRIDDRLGRTSGDFVSALPLTVLAVTSREGSSVTCRIHSAARHRLGARANVRLSRYGLAVRMPRRDTRVVLQSTAATAAPLVDYELIEKDESSSAVQVLARTDAFGAAEIAANDRPWRLIYVRQGEHLLARLPLVTGHQPQLVVPLASNDVRLRAEGFVAALKQEVVDTVARRQILAARLRQRIAAGKYDEAERLLEELQGLAGSREFDRRLQEARTKVVGDSARSQQRIDEMFRETRASLERYLDPQEIDRLETQLAQARNQR